jgi:outer membrane protein OmpA-like peptidoglycan-associated protein
MIKKYIIFLFFSLWGVNIIAQEQMKTYQNYDFVPGEKILFEDNFTDGLDGEFPPLWKLKVGQAVVNKQGDQSVFVIIDGNYGIVEPRIKTPTYLDNNFTIECDYYADDGDFQFGIIIMMPSSEEDELAGIHFDSFGNAATHYLPSDINLRGSHPDAEKYETSKWRHIAIAYKDGQMKCYIDQHRVLVIPDVEYQPKYVRVGGVASIKFKNFKIALGGGMNMLDKLYKEGRIVTRGILFDVNKATIKPQSMGVLNEITKMLKQDEKIKLSIEGHTDSDGSDESNKKLSEQRAESVKKALVELGIDSSRLTTKGWGESKPVGKNDSPEDKANNRRVEFVLVK